MPSLWPVFPGPECPVPTIHIGPFLPPNVHLGEQGCKTRKVGLLSPPPSLGSRVLSEKPFTPWHWTFLETAFPQMRGAFPRKPSGNFLHLKVNKNPLETKESNVKVAGVPLDACNTSWLSKQAPLSLFWTQQHPSPMFCPQNSKSFPFCNCCITFGSCASKGDAPGMKHEREVTQLPKR